MFAPEQPAVARGQRHHLIRQGFHQHLLLRIAHVQRWTHVQHARVDVAEHAVAQAVAVEQRAKLDDIVGKVLRRHGGILDKGDRLGAPFGIAQQAYRFFPHVVDALDAVEILAELIADHAALSLRHQALQPRAERSDLLLD